MRTFDSLGKKKVVLGLVHLKPMPGTPNYEEGMFEESLEKAIHDALALQNGGADGCLIQTVDRIYPKADEADYTRVAGMAALVHAVAKVVRPDFQIGAQIMWNGIKPSLAVAKVCDASFTRCTALVGATLTPFGMVEADPYSVMQYRKSIGAQHIKMIAEIEGMHFKWFGGKPIAEIARSAAMVGAAAVEIAIQDEEANARAIAEVRKAMPDLPIILGGYTNHENAARRLALADGAFVGTCLEEGGWGRRIDEKKVRDYMEIVRSL